MIDFAETFHIKKPGGRLYRVVSRIHQTCNSVTLFPRPVCTLTPGRLPGAFDLTGQVRDRADVRLVVLTDLHLPGRRSVANLQGAVSELRLQSPRPDAVLVTGDIAELGSERSYRLFSEIMADLDGIPYYTIPGNHDLRGLIRGRYQRYITDPLDFSIDCGSVRLLMVGSCDHRVPSHTLSWLDDELLNHPKTPHLVFMHYHPLPVLNFSTPRALGRWLDTSLLDNTDELMLKLLGHRNVIGLFHGHTHLSLHQKFHGLSVVGTGSISAHQPGQTSDPSYRFITIREGQMQTETKFIGGSVVVGEAIHVVDDLYRAG